MRMRHVGKLNPGGGIGAFVAGASMLVYKLLVKKEPPDRTFSKLVVLAIVVGALAGNFLWRAIFPKPEPPPGEEHL